MQEGFSSLVISLFPSSNGTPIHIGCSFGPSEVGRLGTSGWHRWNRARESSRWRRHVKIPSVHLKEVEHRSICVSRAMGDEASMGRWAKQKKHLRSIFRRLGGSEKKKPSDCGRCEPSLETLDGSGGKLCQVSKLFTSKERHTMPFIIYPRVT